MRVIKFVKNHNTDSAEQLILRRQGSLPHEPTLTPTRGVAEGGGLGAPAPPEILGPKKFTRRTLMICPKFEILGGSAPPPRNGSAPPEICFPATPLTPTLTSLSPDLIERNPFSESLPLHKLLPPTTLPLPSSLC